MYCQFLILIPALVAMIWAVCVKLKGGKYFETLCLVICAIALTVNVVVEYDLFLNGSTSYFLYFLKSLFLTSIVPLAYLYFSRQIGRVWNNATTIMCWGMMIFILFPNVNVFLGTERSAEELSLIRDFSVSFIKDGRLLFTMHIADLVIYLQAMLTVLRIIPTAKTLRKYDLMLSPKMMGFFFWWIAAVIYITITSFATTATLATTVGSWMYVITYSILVTSIYAMLAMNFDLHPVITVEEKESVDIDSFIESNRNMASRLRNMMEMEKVYLHFGYSTEDAVTALNTNRTYFSRMMNAEFGMKFSDLVNEYRVNHAKTLLSTTGMSISEIAYESGFSDASYMNKKFHQIVGESPSAFRG